MQIEIIVNAFWDDEAKVWVATSNDIDGLAIEADSFEELTIKIPNALADLIELNCYDDYKGLPEIPFHLMASHNGAIQNPIS